MERRYDYNDEDVQEVSNVVLETPNDSMDEETTQILIEDRVSTGG